MSFWTDFRDGLEAAASVVLNFYYPGAGAVLGQFTSEGSQNYLSQPWGQAAMMGAGIYGGGSGNLANYGKTLDWIANGAGAGGAGSLGGGVSGTSTISDQIAMQDMLNQGYTQEQALDAVYGGRGGASTYGNTSGAAPTFTGQQMAGAEGYWGPTGGISNTGTLGAGGMTPQPQGAIQAAASTGAMPWSGQAGGAPNMGWGSPGNVANILQGISGIAQSRNMQDRARQADPFAQYREQYGQRLQRLAEDPSMIENEPGYQAGLRAVQRSMAAQGYTGSGNMMAAIAKYGQDFYERTANRYAGLAGAGVNPVNAQQLGLSQDAYRNNLFRTGVNNLGYAGIMAGGWPRG